MLTQEVTHLLEYSIEAGCQITLGDHSGFIFSVKSADFQQIFNDIHLADYCIAHIFDSKEKHRVGWAHFQEDEYGAYELVDMSMTPFMLAWKTFYEVDNV
jgi:hypothetical protein